MDEKNLNTPEASDNQWLKDLLDTAPTEPLPDAPVSAEDEQWLQELFSSAEHAAEQSLSQDPAQEAVQEEELPPLILDQDVFMDLSGQDASPETKEAEPEELPPLPEPAPHKRRPVNHDRYGLFGIPHILVTAVWLAIVVLFGAFLGQWLWQGASDVLAFGREDKVVTITITESDDLNSLTEKLYSAGLIHQPTWFRLYGQLTDVMEDVGVGTFELNTLYDYHALVSHMSASSKNRVTIKVVIPEGYNCAQIFALLEEKGVCTVAALEEASMYGELNKYWFMEGISRENKYCLEGYLYPDTYEFYVGDNATRVINKFLSNFDIRFTDIMRNKLATLNETLAEMMAANGLSDEYISSHLYTIREVIIIASLIEKETANAKEGYTISSVIYNRLTDPYKYPYLNIDAALVYATGHSVLTEEDKLLDSPYNTYLYSGLVPGPITNPSRASLDAALDPPATLYYYYAYNPATGTHHFSATYAEHQAFLESLKQEE